MLVTQHFVALFEKDNIKVKNILDGFTELKTTYKDIETEL